MGGGGGTHTMGGGVVATRDTEPYIYIYIYIYLKRLKHLFLCSARFLAGSWLQPFSRWGTFVVEKYVIMKSSRAKHRRFSLNSLSVARHQGKSSQISYYKMIYTYHIFIVCPGRWFWRWTKKAKPWPHLTPQGQLPNSLISMSRCLWSIEVKSTSHFKAYNLDLCLL